jgi:tetratricopeptide (TPR) repeat protein
MRPLLVLLLTLVCAPAFASEGERGRPVDETSDFWRELRQPGHRRAQQLLAQGIRMLQTASQESRPFRKAALIGNALARFTLARSHVPDDPELLFFHARALALYERPVPGSRRTERRDDDAIALYERLREVAPDHRVEEVGFELGILYTRVRDYEKAIAAYERSVTHALSDDQTPISYSNMAEVRMMSGDLQGAVADYERAVSLSRSGGPLHGRSLALSLFGLAVAMDRLGEHGGAVEKAGDAVSAGGGSIGVLRSDGVFYEPAAEIHWYEALGHLAMAEAAGPNERSPHLRRAVQSWRSYVRLATDDDEWKALAERRLRETEEALEAARGDRES